ncbi:MAG: hypothetical protein RLZZ565_854, partial [Planctomycetota bacterium]
LSPLYSLLTPLSSLSYHLAVADTITIDFNEPIAVFPLWGAILLPHAPQALHIFEPRYRQMVEDCLESVEDGNLLKAKPIAMAIPAGPSWDGPTIGDPPLRPAVCVGKIVQHARLPDGRHNVILHGVCRARIVEVMEPAPGRLYRFAKMVPIEEPGRVPRLAATRRRLRELLEGPRLSRMASADAVREWISREDVPTHALVELVSYALLKDDEVRYRLLAEPDARERAKLLTSELLSLDRLVALADRQEHKSWPKGMSWN